LHSGNRVIMNEHVDWAAMSDEEFIALVRQLLEVPAGVDSEED